MIDVSKLNGLTFPVADFFYAQTDANADGTYTISSQPGSVLNESVNGIASITVSQNVIDKRFPNHLHLTFTMTVGGQNGPFPYVVVGYTSDQILLMSTTAPSTFVISNTGTAPVAGMVYGTSATYTPPCFAAGTRLWTPDGEVAVERLRVGDLVLTIGGAARPISWIGSRAVDCRSHPDPASVHPVRIAAGAFAEGLPRRDLLLSPDHAVFAEGVLIPVRYLLNGSTVRQIATDSVAYFHIELDHHDVVLAEGLPAETFLDTGNRADLDRANDGDVALSRMMTSSELNVLSWEAAGYAQLCVCGSEVDAVRDALARRAEPLVVGGALSDAA